MAMKSIVLIFGLFGLAGVALGNPRYDGHWREEPRVIIYEDADFRGGSLVLYPGEQIPNLRDARFSNGKRVNDRISSVRIEGGASIALYDDYDFGGQVLRTTTAIRNLAFRPMPDIQIPWNDRISSLKVTAGRRPGIAGPAADPLIKQAYRDVLGREADPEGLRYYRGLAIDQGWTDRMVREHMRNSDEFRHGAADRMIERAYHDVLGRAPDPEGREKYRQLMLRKNWSEQQLREVLRSSPEYRDRPADDRH